MKEIKLYHKKNTTHNLVALVDDEDFEYLNQWKWSAQRGYKTYYATRNDKLSGRHILMHREILGILNSKKIGDHKDKNGLNNRRSNLREATYGQNQVNSCRKGKINKYRGVYKRKDGKYNVTIRKNGHSRTIGTFYNEYEAAKAFDLAAIRLHGEFAVLNFPDI